MAEKPISEKTPIATSLLIVIVGLTGSSAWMASDLRSTAANNIENFKEYKSSAEKRFDRFETNNRALFEAYKSSNDNRFDGFENALEKNENRFESRMQKLETLMTDVSTKISNLKKQ